MHIAASLVSWALLCGWLAWYTLEDTHPKPRTVFFAVGAWLLLILVSLPPRPSGRGGKETVLPYRL